MPTRERHEIWKAVEKNVYESRSGRGRRPWGQWWDDEVFALLERHRNVALESMKERHLKSKRILVIGCGDGRDIRTFIELADFVLGIDISPSQLRSAKHFLPTVDFIAGDAENPPLRHGSFQVVYCKAILHHLQNLRDALRALRMVTGKEGVLFISAEPGLLNPIAAIGRRFFPSEVHTPGERPFLFSSLRNLLFEEGYCQQEAQYFYLISPLFPILSKWLGSPYVKVIFKRLVKWTLRVENYLLETALRDLAWVLQAIYVRPAEDR